MRFYDYTIRYRCGHTLPMRLFGSRRSRTRYVRRCALRPCSDCRAVERAKGVEEDRALVRSRYALPSLKGSARQVAWASGIRSSWVAGRMRAGGDVDSFYPFLCSLDEASWWIGNRGKLGEAVEEAWLAWLM